MDSVTYEELAGNGVTAAVRVHKLAWFEKEKENASYRENIQDATINTFLVRIPLDDSLTLSEWMGKIDDVYWKCGLERNGLNTVMSEFTPDEVCERFFNQYQAILEVDASTHDALALSQFALENY